MLAHALHCSVAQRSRLIPLSVSPNSDESGKQSLYPDGDPHRHQNVIVCSLAHCQSSLKISCKSVRKFLLKVANRQTNNDESVNVLGGGNQVSNNENDERQQLNADDDSSATTSRHACAGRWLAQR